MKTDEEREYKAEEDEAGDFHSCYIKIKMKKTKQERITETISERNCVDMMLRRILGVISREMRRNKEINELKVIILTS